MPAGLYVHIPFCHRKCHYCDFYSIPFQDRLARQFVEALKEEISVISATRPWSEMLFSSLYVGGGTPTVLSGSQLKEIFEHCLNSFQFEREVECTIEANPETTDAEKLGTLLDVGVNRLSLGVQSLEDDELKRLGRIHTVERALIAYRTARAVGFENIGIDLIFAIPGQSLESWKATLKRAVGLQPEHISTYNLTVEPGTVYGKEIAAGKLSRPSEDTEADMYAYVINFLGAQGYEHYEVSNFARPGFRSRHNQLYWDHSPYLGLGPSAHSFFESLRWERVRDVNEFIRRTQLGQPTISEEEELTLEKLMAEALFLALRTREGLNVILFRERFGADVEDVFGEAIEKYTDLKMLEREGPFLRLTREGFMVANSICAEFV